MMMNSGLKRWLQQGNLPRSQMQVMGTTTQTQLQAERKLVVQLGAENQALLESAESRTYSVEKNLRRRVIKLSNEIFISKGFSNTKLK